MPLVVLVHLVYLVFLILLTLVINIPLSSYSFRIGAKVGNRPVAVADIHHVAVSVIEGEGLNNPNHFPVRGGPAIS